MWTATAGAGVTHAAEAIESEKEYGLLMQTARRPGDS